MKRIFFIALFSVFALAAFSQSSLTALQYSVGFGTGDMHEYIGNTSWRGFTIDYRNMVQSNIGVGVDLGWNVFYEEMPDAVYEYENVTYAGKQWRYSNHFPALLAADYYVRKGEMVSAFAGLGLGVMYSLQNTNMGTYTFEKDAWHFALRPELGLIIEASPGASLMVASKYYYGFKAGDLPAQGYVTVNVGLVFNR
jgi:outer membrane protein